MLETARVASEPRQNRRKPWSLDNLLVCFFDWAAEPRDFRIPGARIGDGASPKSFWKGCGLCHARGHIKSKRGVETCPKSRGARGRIALGRGIDPRLIQATGAESCMAVNRKDKDDRRLIAVPPSCRILTDECQQLEPRELVVLLARYWRYPYKVNRNTNGRSGSDKQRVAWVNQHLDVPVTESEYRYTLYQTKRRLTDVLESQRGR